MPESVGSQNSKNRNRKLPRTESHQQVADCVQQQMVVLGRDKEKRTTAEQKVDSQLLAVIRCAQYITPSQEGAMSLADGLVTVDADGRTVVDIVVRDLTLAQSRLKSMGKTPKSRIEVLSAIGNNIRARLRLEQITTVASSAEVVFINPLQEARTGNRHKF